MNRTFPREGRVRTVEEAAVVEAVDADTVVTEAVYVVLSAAVVAPMVVLARLKLATAVAERTIVNYGSSKCSVQVTARVELSTARVVETPTEVDRRLALADEEMAALVVTAAAVLVVTALSTGKQHE